MVTCCGSTKARSVPTNTIWWSKPPRRSRGADKTYVFQNIGDGRAAAFLPARSPLNDLVGIAMIIADAKFLDSKGAAKFVTPTTTNLMRRLAFLRRPPPPAAPAPPPRHPPANKVVSPQARAPRRPPPAPPPARGPVRRSPLARRPRAAPRPGVAPPSPPRRPRAAAAREARRPQPRREPAAAARTRAPPRAPGRRESNPVQRPSGDAESDSIAFEISDIDPKALLKSSRPAAPEAKRPDLRVVQTDRLPKLELRSLPIPSPS